MYFSDGETCLLKNQASWQMKGCGMFFQRTGCNFHPSLYGSTTQLSSAVVDGGTKADIYKDVTLPPQAPLPAFIADK